MRSGKADQIALMRRMTRIFTWRTSFCTFCLLINTFLTYGIKKTLLVSQWYIKLLASFATDHSKAVVPVVFLFLRGFVVFTSRCCLFCACAFLTDKPNRNQNRIGNPREALIFLWVIKQNSCRTESHTCRQKTRTYFVQLLSQKYWCLSWILYPIWIRFSFG